MSVQSQMEQNRTETHEQDITKFQRQLRMKKHFREVKRLQNLQLNSQTEPPLMMPNVKTSGKATPLVHPKHLLLFISNNEI